MRNTPLRAFAKNSPVKHDGLDLGLHHRSKSKDLATKAAKAAKTISKNKKT